MNNVLISLFVIATSAALPLFADAEKGPFAPPLRKEGEAFPAPATAYDASKLKMENLGLGVVAVRTGEDGKDIWVTWRYRSIDPTNICYNVYRDGEKITSEPIADVTWFIDKDAWKGAAIEYEVRQVLFSRKERKEHKGEGHEVRYGHGKWVVPADAPIGAIDIPIEEPPEDVLPDGSKHGHHANDCSVGDADGDGEYEIFLKYEANASRDNIGGDTGRTWFYCLKLDGSLLWRLHTGFNLNAGPHYQPFVVADFDGDGKAELIVRTAPGTIDGTGRVLTDSGKWIAESKAKYLSADETILICDPKFNPADDTVGDYRRGGHPLETPEFLTVFDGKTGRAMDTVKYDPPFGNFWIWGDWIRVAGNRSHRFLATTAYLDGVHPSAVMCRGYYARTCLAAWDWDGHNLRERWLFDSESPRWRGKGFGGQGNHNLRVCDIDFDGKDEIIYGSMTVDDDGTGLYSSGYGHGDQIHLVQCSPEHIGLQIFTCQEHGETGVVLRDAKTGKTIWRVVNGRDVGNCLAGDFDPDHRGCEFFGAASIGCIGMNGTMYGPARGTGMYYQTLRMGITWTGDMLRQLLPGSDGVWWYNIRCRGTGLVTPFHECDANNASKGNPCLVADFLGDWREEAMYRRRDNKALRVNVSTIPTDYRFWTFMEDPCYRNSVAAENAGYNVCPEPSFYFGPDLKGHGIWFRGCCIP